MNRLDLKSKIERIVGQYLSKKIKKIIIESSIYRIYDRSALNWKYPFFVLGWMLANYLTKARNHSVDGINLTIPCENWITHFRWYNFKIKEIEVRNFIRQMMGDEDIFFDIGANIGVFSVYAAKIHPNSKVFSFEPEYSNLHLLKNNVISNKIDHQIHIVSVGISDKVGFSKLYLSNLDSGAAVHTESREDIDATDEGYKVVWEEGIMTSTLDYLCQSLEVIPNCIKIDTDGNEYKILKGALNTLKNSELRSLIIEMPHHNENQTEACEKILKDSGFFLYWSNKRKTKNEVWTK